MNTVTLLAPRGGAVLLIIYYTERFNPVGVPLFRLEVYTKRFHELKHRKGFGNLSFRYAKGSFKISRTGQPKGDTDFYCRYVKGIPCSMDDIQKVTFSLRKGI